MFSQMQALRAASPNGSTGLGQQSDAEGAALRESFTRLDQAQSPTAYKAALDEVVARLEKSKTRLESAYTAEFAPLRKGAAAAPANTGGGLTVTAPDGSAHLFPNQAAADAFRKAIGQ